MKAVIERILASGLEDLAHWYPIVSVTGPRQSGKSTLVRATFPNHRYLNLEDPAVRSRALADPSGFIANNPGPLVLDEVQRAPELFSAVQAASDASPQMGKYVLSGSQNFLMMQAIRQSLAGRVGIAKLLPLSFAEIKGRCSSMSVLELVLRGFYPQLHASDIPTSLFYENYVDTYVTRDVVGYLDVRNEAGFRTFLRLCASRVGNLVNMSSLANEAGVSVPTVKNWFSLLESSYVVKLLQPYHANLAKRLTKTPKLYFYDTGLLCHLLGIDSVDWLANDSACGAVFENFAIMERVKMCLNSLRPPELCFYRDDSKVEVDLMDLGETPALLAEIKSGQTYRTTFARHVRRVAAALPMSARGMVVYGGEGVFDDNGIQVCGIRDWVQLDSGPAPAR